MRPMLRFPSTPPFLPSIVVVSFVAIACSKAEPEKSATSEAPVAASEAPASADQAPATGKPPCGKKGQPDCPLQGWMKKNLKAALKEDDLAKVAEGLDKVASHAPDGYDDWKEIAMNGAKVARDNDTKGVKRQCKSCHDKYQKRYRKERRTEPLI